MVETIRLIMKGSVRGRREWEMSADDFHIAATFRTGKGIYFIDFLDQFGPVRPALFR